MTIKTTLNLPQGNAICYSGYREGQSPRTNIFPSYDEIREDLLILQDNWSLLRLYDCSQHAHTVLEVIATEDLDFKVMLGTDLEAEVSNPDCPWGADYSDEKLKENRLVNSKNINTMIRLANSHPTLVFAVSIGNEASVEWTDHMVPLENLIEYAKRVKSSVEQPVTFCENYVPWQEKLLPLTQHLDFISVHTYPIWEFQNVENAMSYSEQNLKSVRDANPGMPIVITEAGWTTTSNGRGMEPQNASEALQAQYVPELMKWCNEQGLLCFVFEAFDEPWKGSKDPFEPEKHWGLYYVNRQPKKVVSQLQN